MKMIPLYVHNHNAMLLKDSEHLREVRIKSQNFLYPFFKLLSSIWWEIYRKINGGYHRFAWEIIQSLIVLNCTRFIIPLISKPKKCREEAHSKIFGL